ncbi:Uu.00g134120.m01.CDS01 [Anthostomella pinea]|uniref:Uu.00g134120.m01.CDS01 n=1 Tax=Anthostomella pinea TaxID=933095 RepID=A0AAI8YKN8_9PEZI|nr:Uu.00g134120.m01.CDS01 [Anthostomella pinea]
MGVMKQPSDSISLKSPNHDLGVTFLAEPTVAVIESSWSPYKVSRVTMAKQVYETFAGSHVTDAMLVEAAKLFSENYGIWGERSHQPGKHVMLSAPRLRSQYLPSTAATSYVRVVVDGTLAGNVFACRWEYKGKTVCWVTQLVVDKEYRERGLASGLLRSLRLNVDDVYGIMSSHPAACLAAAACFGTTIEKVPLDFIAENADLLMKSSPIRYIHDAKLCGSLFNTEDSTGLVSGVDTGFFVDHGEPLEALSLVRETWNWPLGELPDGHEYLLIVQGKHRRSRSRSVPKSTDQHLSGN